MRTTTLVLVALMALGASPRPVIAASVWGPDAGVPSGSLSAYGSSSLWTPSTPPPFSPYSGSNAVFPAARATGSSGAASAALAGAIGLGGLAAGLASRTMETAAGAAADNGGHGHGAGH